SGTSGWGADAPDGPTGPSIEVPLRAAAISAALAVPDALAVGPRPRSGADSQKTARPATPAIPPTTTSARIARPTSRLAPRGVFRRVAIVALALTVLPAAPLLQPRRREMSAWTDSLSLYRGRPGPTMTAHRPPGPFQGRSSLARPPHPGP